MKKYIITDIGDDSNIDEFERFGLGIKTMDTNVKLNVGCVDSYKYVAGENARKNGDIIEGDLNIEEAHFVGKTDLELMHKWTGVERFKVCPEMEMVVEVTRILDDYHICGLTDITEEELLIEFSIFSDKINTDKKYFKEGDKILLSKAKLCLDIWGDIEEVKKAYGIS